MTEKWWKKKWYWILCILLPLVLIPTTNLFFFPEMPLFATFSTRELGHGRTDKLDCVHNNGFFRQLLLVAYLVRKRLC